jgi:hypothetical protein
MATTPVAVFTKLASQCEAEGLSSANCEQIASELARTFGVHDDEVALLKVQDGAHLVFVYPPKLAHVGIIPLSNSSAVAARTVNTRRAEVLNNFAQAKHASVFEAVKIGSKTRQQAPEAAITIQKLMTVPVVSPAGVLGVVQISRKGSSPQAAGADFMPADLQKLVTCAGALVKCFK